MQERTKAAATRVQTELAQAAAARQTTWQHQNMQGQLIAQLAASNAQQSAAMRQEGASIAAATTAALEIGDAMGGNAGHLLAASTAVSNASGPVAPAAPATAPVAVSAPAAPMASRPSSVSSAQPAAVGGGASGNTGLGDGGGGGAPPTSAAAVVAATDDSVSSPEQPPRKKMRMPKVRARAPAPRRPRQAARAKPPVCTAVGRRAAVTARKMGARTALSRRLARRAHLSLALSPLRGCC